MFSGRKRLRVYESIIISRIIYEDSKNGLPTSQRYYTKYFFRKDGKGNACLHAHFKFKEFSNDVHHGPLYSQGYVD